MRKGVKVCGAMSKGDIEKAGRGGAQAVGVIIRPDTTYETRSQGSRSLNPAKAKRRREEAAANGLDFVAVMNTADPDEILEIAEAVQPDRIQLRPGTTVAAAFAVRSYYWGKEFRPEIAQVMAVDDATEPEDIDAFAPHVHYVHLDSPGPRPGGNGVPHDWERSARVAERAHDHGKLVILAGGLTVANVAAAIKVVRPDHLDIQTGISPYGVFNERRIREFVDAAV